MQFWQSFIEDLKEVLTGLYIIYISTIKNNMTAAREYSNSNNVNSKQILHVA